MDEQIRLFLADLVREIVGVATVVVDVRLMVEPDGTHTYSIGVPAEVRGLLIGPSGKHVGALETVAKMRALRIGWRGRINVRVPKNG